MTAAHPLSFDDDLDVQPVTEELLASLSPEERALGEEVARAIDEGKMPLVPQAEIERYLAERRPEHGA